MLLHPMHACSSPLAIALSMGGWCKSPYDLSKEAQPSQLVANQADLAGLTI